MFKSDVKHKYVITSFVSAAFNLNSEVSSEAATSDAVLISFTEKENLKKNMLYYVDYSYSGHLDAQ